MKFLPNCQNFNLGLKLKGIEKFLSMALKNAFNFDSLSEDKNLDHF